MRGKMECGGTTSSESLSARTEYTVVQHLRFEGTPSAFSHCTVARGAGLCAQARACEIVPIGHEAGWLAASLAGLSQEVCEVASSRSWMRRRYALEFAGGQHVCSSAWGCLHACVRVRFRRCAGTHFSTWQALGAMRCSCPQITGRLYRVRVQRYEFVQPSMQYTSMRWTTCNRQHSRRSPDGYISCACISSPSAIPSSLTLGAFHTTCSMQHATYTCHAARALRGTRLAKLSHGTPRRHCMRRISQWSIHRRPVAQSRAGAVAFVRQHSHVRSYQPLSESNWQSVPVLSSCWNRLRRQLRSRCADVMLPYKFARLAAGRVRAAIPALPICRTPAVPRTSRGRDDQRRLSFSLGLLSDCALSERRIAALDGPLCSEPVAVHRTLPRLSCRLT